MFGYIRPYKPEMKVKEFDTYKAVYCGLCKELGKAFGIASRMTLSYDFAFLALLHMAVNDSCAGFQKGNCIAHPFKKAPYALSNDALSYSAACAVISIYYKVLDNCEDARFIKKLPPAAMLPFAKAAFRKSAGQYPQLATAIGEHIAMQNKLEREHCASIDQSAEPTALIMSQIAAGITADEQKQRILQRFGYQLGRWIYLIDALDDLERDCKDGAYNPYLLYFQITRPDQLTADKLTEIRSYAQDSIFLTQGEIGGSYSLLSLEKFSPILDNIVYLGLQNTFSMTLNKEKKHE